MHQLLATLSYYSYAFIFCELLNVLADRLGHRYVRLTKEFIATFQKFLLSYELLTILQTYGLSAYALLMAPVLFVYYRRQQSNVFANPSSLMEHFLIGNGGMSLVSFVTLLASQLFAATVAFQFARIFWRLELAEQHGLRFRDVACTMPLKVSLSTGLICEFLATFTDRIIGIKLMKVFGRDVGLMLYSAEMVLITLLGMHLTGMFFNPILATGQTFGCSGFTTWNLLVVYWVGPVCGWLLGTQLEQFIPDHFLRDAKGKMD